jgi:hypothetical protein
MPASALARQLELDILPPLRTREEVITRYRHVREVSERINDGLLKLVPRSAIIKQARKLGLTFGRTVVLDSMDQMAFLFDLAIYTAPPDRTRAIDRYARTTRFEAGSDEARVFDAMRNARFTACMVKRRHRGDDLPHRHGARGHGRDRISGANRLGRLTELTHNK